VPGNYAAILKIINKINDLQARIGSTKENLGYTFVHRPIDFIVGFKVRNRR
jgi:hypothetical protein